MHLIDCVIKIILIFLEIDLQPMPIQHRPHAQSYVGTGNVRTSFDLSSLSWKTMLSMSLYKLLVL